MRAGCVGDPQCVGWATISQGGAAVQRTLEEPAVHSEQQTTAPRGRDRVEDFIAPDRVQARSALQKRNTPLGELPTEVISIGLTAWFRDTGAEPPADELFVQCPLQAVSTPEVFIYLGFIGEAIDVHRLAGSDERFRFVLDVNDRLLKQIFDEAPGTATVKNNRVTRFQFTTPKSREDKRYRVTWDLRFGEVENIEGPGPAQIASADCKFTEGKDGTGITIEPAP